ncbi:MAG: sulfotransferase [Desulfobacteraceae bacterium]|nr:sulfotransferase [Desulfobacteraceae bacterium]
MNDPFFIVGNSRSGTTLVSRILKNHPDIHVLNETHVFDEFASEKQRFQALNESEIFRMINSMLTIQRKDYYRKSEYEEYPEEAGAILAAFRQHPDQQTFGALNKLFFDHEASKNGKSRSGDQTPRHVFNIDEIFLLYPEAKIIHMVRDPRAVLFSQKKNGRPALDGNNPFLRSSELLSTTIPSRCPSYGAGPLMPD